MKETDFTYYINGEEEYTYLVKKKETFNYPICTMLNASLKGKSLSKSEKKIITDILDWLVGNPEMMTKENIEKINCALHHRVGKPALTPFDIDTKPYTTEKEQNEKIPDNETPIFEYLDNLCDPDTKVYTFYYCRHLRHCIIATLLCIAERGNVLSKCQECGRYFENRGRTTKKYCSNSCKYKRAERERKKDKDKKDISYYYKKIYNLYHPNKANQEKLLKEREAFKKDYRGWKKEYDNGDISKETLLERMSKYEHK